MTRMRGVIQVAAVTGAILTACLASGCGSKQSAKLVSVSESVASDTTSGPLILQARPFVVADGTPTILLTLTNSGPDRLVMEAAGLPWNRLDRRRVHVEKDGRPFTVFEINGHEGHASDWEESLMPGASMMGYVVVGIEEPGRYTIRARTNCTFAVGHKNGPVKTVPLAISPVAVDVPTRNFSEGPRERLRRAYEVSIARANDHLSAGDLNSALAECTNAEELQITTQTRELRKRILDARDAVELAQKADVAMEEKDYSLASNLYADAMQIQSTEKLEEKHRHARAFVLYELASDDLRRGDQSGARSKLTQSLWYFKTVEAESLLAQLATSRPTPKP